MVLMIGAQIYALVVSIKNNGNVSLKSSGFSFVCSIHTYFGLFVSDSN
mgnify:CR=1 FL=1